VDGGTTLKDCVICRAKPQPKRFLLFGWEGDLYDSYPSGGSGDLIGKFASIEKIKDWLVATEIIDQTDSGLTTVRIPHKHGLPEYLEILDMNTGKWYNIEKGKVPEEFDPYADLEEK
jgi:hypothetical protein